jgi:hypothetical protein
MNFKGPGLMTNELRIKGVMGGITALLRRVTWQDPPSGLAVSFRND